MGTSLRRRAHPAGQPPAVAPVPVEDPADPAPSPPPVEIARDKAVVTSPALDGGGKIPPARVHPEKPEVEDETTLSARTHEVYARKSLLGELVSANAGAPEALAALDPDELADLHDDLHEAADALAASPGARWVPAPEGPLRGLVFQGQPIAIELDAGEMRRGVSPDGRAWAREMVHPYGYIPGTEGLDGEAVDVYVGPDPLAPDAFVVHQSRALGPGAFGGYDEDKVMVGFPDEHAARAAYLVHYPDVRFLAGVTRLPVHELFQLARDGGSLRDESAPLVSSAWGKTAKCLGWEPGMVSEEKANPSCVSEKIPKLVGEGYPREQAITIAYSMCGKRVAKTLFPSPAGKRAVAKKIASVFPEHQTYVEPFAGSAAVLFAKEKAPLEIIADADADIARAFRVAKSLDEDALARMEKMDWIGAPATFETLKSSSPEDDVDWLHKFLYTRRFGAVWSHGNFRQGSDGVVSRAVKRLRAFGPRLADVRVLSGDFERTAKSFDAPDTLHFFDPPYAGKNGAVGLLSVRRDPRGRNIDDFDEERFLKMLNGLEGKWVVTYAADSPMNARLKKAGADVRYFEQVRNISRWRGGDPVMWQSLAANFDLPDEEWLHESAPAPRKKARDASVSLADVARVHDEILVPELIRRGKPHDTPLLLAARTLTPDGAFRLALLHDEGRIVFPDLPGFKDGQPTEEAKRKRAANTDAEIVEVSKRSEPELRTVTGVVLAPEQTDAQGDIYDKPVIRDAAWKFLANYNDGTKLGFMHSDFTRDFELLESWIAPVDMEIGGRPIKAGSWVMTVRVLDDAIWKAIREGRIKGFSIGGMARVESLQ